MIPLSVIEENMMAKTFLFLFIAVPLLALSPTGCTKLVLRSSPELFDHLTQALFEECDPGMAQSAMPAELKILEGLSKSDPENSRLLTTLCMGYAGYALLYVEDEDAGRASELYLRSKNFGIRAMGPEARILDGPAPTLEDTHRALSQIGAAEVEALLWTAMAWNSWVRLNLDKPTALAQSASAQACLDRVLEIQADFFHGVPYILKGATLAAKPGLLGGDLPGAKACFEQALKQTERHFFLAQYYYARYYAVSVQDKALFLSLLKEVASGAPDDLKSVCLINAVMQKKARKLMARAEDLFI